MGEDFGAWEDPGGDLWKILWDDGAVIARAITSTLEPKRIASVKNWARAVVETEYFTKENGWKPR